MADNYPRCPRCGIKRSGPSMYCPVCGYEYDKLGGSTERNQPSPPSGNVYPNEEGRKRSSGPRSPFPPPLVNPSKTIWPKKGDGKGNPVSGQSTSMDVLHDHEFSFMAIFGYRTLTGTVIAVEQPYLSKPEINWAIALLKLMSGLVLLPFIIGIALAFSILSHLLPFARRGRPGFLSHVASQVVGFFLTGKLFGPKDQVPVRDIRLKDAAGHEHLVRIRGELIAGNVNVGDEVEVEGFNRSGTLMFRRGRNKRTHSEITIKYK